MQNTYILNMLDKLSSSLFLVLSIFYYSVYNEMFLKRTQFLIVLSSEYLTETK
jgi:hypothetical protein